MHRGLIYIHIKNANKSTSLTCQQTHRGLTISMQMSLQLAANTHHKCSSLERLSVDNLSVKLSTTELHLVSMRADKKLRMISL
jgi:hypothetical protein